MSSQSLTASPIRSFQSTMQHVVSFVETMSSTDLLMAFRVTLNLLERIGELMHNASNESKFSSTSLSEVEVTPDESNSFSNFIAKVETEDDDQPNYPSPKKRFLSTRISKRKPVPVRFPGNAFLDLDEDDHKNSAQRCDLPLKLSSSEDNTHVEPSGGLPGDDSKSSNGNPDSIAVDNSEPCSDQEDIKPRSESLSDINQSMEAALEVTMELPSVSSQMQQSCDTMDNKGFTTSQTTWALSQESLTGPSEIDQYRDADLRLQYERRQARMYNSDRLNQLIDECEKELDGKKIYKCKFCGKLYEIKSSMRYHMKIIHLQMHLQTSDMQCKVCGKRFTCISAVNRHQIRCLLSSQQAARNGDPLKSSASPVGSGQYKRSQSSASLSPSKLQAPVWPMNTLPPYPQEVPNSASCSSNTLSSNGGSKGEFVGPAAPSTELAIDLSNSQLKNRFSY